LPSKQASLSQLCDYLLHVQQLLLKVSLELLAMLHLCFLFLMQSSKLELVLLLHLH